MATMAAAPLLTQPPLTAGNMEERELPRSRIIIPLASKPRDYTPGSGPPLQQVTLLPAQDSTAYIMERILLPSAGLARSGKPLPKRMTYLVGWTDLPAAQLLVPAMDILDYVSPLALEEWEAELEESLDDDRAKMEQELRLPKKLAPGVRKRGRPPKHSLIEAAAVAAEPETEEQTRERMKRAGGAMSLSTPQKKRMQDFEGLSEEEGTPSRQLEMEFMQTPGAHIWNSADAKESAAEELAWSNAGVGAFNLQNPDSSRDISARTSTRASVEIVDLAHSLPATPQHRNSDGMVRHISVISAYTPTKTGAQNLATAAERESSVADVTFLQSYPIPLDATSKGPTAKTTQSKPKPKAKPKKKRRKSNSADAEMTNIPEWEILRLEDVELYEVEGRGIVRYFKVRWNGDWPEDQNPTWEPEDNIPPNMVRNYFKQSKKRLKTASKPVEKTGPKKKASAGKKKKTTPPKANGTWDAGKQYKTVAEAFTGNPAAEVILIEDERAAPEPVSDFRNGGLDDELFIVDESQGPPVQGTKTFKKLYIPPDFGLF